MSDRINTVVARVVTKMQRGCALHFEQGKRSRWWLSDGSEVPEQIALAVTRRPDVVSVDTALFHGMRPQTWRFVGE